MTKSGSDSAREERRATRSQRRRSRRPRLPRAALGLPSASLEVIDRCQRVPSAAQIKTIASQSDISVALATPSAALVETSADSCRHESIHRHTERRSRCFDGGCTRHGEALSAAVVRRGRRRTRRFRRRQRLLLCLGRHSSRRERRLSHRERLQRADFRLGVCRALAHGSRMPWLSVSYGREPLDGACASWHSERHTIERGSASARARLPRRSDLGGRSSRCAPLASAVTARASRGQAMIAEGVERYGGLRDALRRPARPRALSVRLAGSSTIVDSSLRIRALADRGNTNMNSMTLRALSVALMAAGAAGISACGSSSS